MSSEDTARIEARYPKAGIGTKLVVAIGLLATAVGIVWLLWASLFHANPAIAGRVDSFKITSDTTADAVVTIQRNSADVAGVCTVIAQAVSFERVGELDVPVAAGGELLATQTVQIRTVQRATSVSVLECRPS